MILTMLVAIATVTCIIGRVIVGEMAAEYLADGHNSWFRLPDSLKDAIYNWTALLVILGFAMMVVIIKLIIANWAYAQLRRYEVLCAEREAIIDAMQHDLQSSMGDAKCFNMRLAELQNTHNDPWHGWFTGRYVMEVEPIPTNVSTIDNALVDAVAGK